MNRNIYVVPDLPTKEIVTYLNELGINTKPQDIQKPTQRTTTALLSSIIQQFFGFTIENEILLYKNFTKLLNDIGINNFEIRDILTPESRRLISFLSAIINFSVFKDSKKYLQDEILANNQEREQLESEIKNQIKVEKGRLIELENSRNNRELEKEKMKEELYRLENEVKQLLKVQRQKLQESEFLRSKRKESEDKLSSIQLVTINLKQEIAALKTQVIRDPTKLTSLIEEMRNLIANEKGSVNDLQNEKRNKECEHNFLLKVIDKIKELIKAFYDLTKNLKYIEKFNEKKNYFEIEIKRLTEDNDILLKKTEHLNRQISHVESKIHNINAEEQRMASDICYRLETLKLAHNETNKERTEKDEKLEFNMKAIKEYEIKTMNLKVEHEREMASIQEELMELKEFVDNKFYVNK